MFNVLILIHSLSTHSTNYYLKKILMFIHFWQRQSTSGMGQRKRETQIPSRLYTLSYQHRAWYGAQTHEPWDPNWSWTLNRLRHPGTPYSTNYWESNMNIIADFFSFSSQICKFLIHGLWIIIHGMSSGLIDTPIFIKHFSLSLVLFLVLKHDSSMVFWFSYD